MSLTVDREPIDVSSLPPNLQKHLQRNAPEKLKMMAARGMLPVSPEENMRVLYQLHFDQSDTIQDAVRDSLGDIPANLLQSALEKEEHPGVLDWVASRRSDEAPVVETIVRNQSTPDETIARLAKRVDGKMCEVIATNQVRVLEAPIILEQLYQNPKARMATIDRLLELARREGVELKGLPGLRDVLKGPRDAFEDKNEDEEQADGRFTELLQEEAEKAAEEDEKFDDYDNLTRSEREELAADDDDEESLDGGRGNLHQKITSMTISEKIRLATIGSRSAINILIRDPNKLVHMAAVKSPRIRLPDVKKWSRDKALPENVISYIANNRDYTRHYEIQVNLVNNPKTPLRDAMKFLSRIRTNDLKAVVRNRNVPNQLQRQAKKLWKTRSGGRGG